MKYGYGVTEKALQTLVEDVLRRRAVEDPELIEAVLRRGLTDESREVIRGVLADELIDSGLADDGEPNERGRLVETAIDWLGHF